MLFTRCPSVSVARRPPYPPGFEPLEGRALLSVGPTADAHGAVAAQVGAVVRPAEQNLIPPPAPNPSGPTTPAGLTDKGKFVAQTAWDGYWLAHSKNVARVGLKFGKLSFAHDTRKVGAAYIKAALKGDGKTLDQLGHANIVKKVGNEFSQLAKSPGVKYVGHQFTHFGHSVVDGYYRVFGHPKPRSK